MAASPTAAVVHGVALLCICILATAVRLFSVVKYESVIHEFDPYFNYRVTQFLTREGFYDMWNWFDDRTWYPLGRVVGGTMYPGLIITAGLMHKFLHALNIPVDVQEVCVFTAPLFAALCALATYGFVRELKGSKAGLLAALFVSVVPSYISRSVAGSFDLEGVAIFALMAVFYMFVKTLNTGSLAWAMGLCATYFYMVLSWGGYSFIINLLPIHALVSIFTGRMNSRLYVAYAPLVAIGTLCAALVPVIGFNAVLMSEHFGAFFAFGVLHVAMAIGYVQKIMPPRMYVRARNLLLVVGAAACACVAVVAVGYAMTSPTFGWSGRSLSLLDPTYAAKYIPIIASVSEHQPPAWNSYFQDIHILVMLMPAGLVACFSPRLTDATLFLVLYGVTAVYFSGVMVRLMLVLAPAAACLAAIGASEVLTVAMRSLKAADDEANDDPPAAASGKAKAGAAAEVAARRRPSFIPREIGLATVMGITMMLFSYMLHCVYVSANLYSAPSIVLQSRKPDGSFSVFDDFREAYSWIRHNTEDDAILASWWDYGYQTTSIANRTVLVDNNTWNNTHIATVGRALASNERKAWRILRMLDVDYVFVVFGGLVGYPSDDMNKFLWMIRIAAGVYPELKEKDFLGEAGYRVDKTCSKTLKESLMYKLSYYRFGDVGQGYGTYDRARNQEVAHTDFDLKYFEEVFTTEHWMMRVYRVKDKPNRDPVSTLKDGRALESGSRRRPMLASKTRKQSGAS